jgi:integrase
VTILGWIMERARKVYGLLSNPVRDVEKLRERHDATRFDFFSTEEVWALVRATASEQDGAVFLTAAFTGMRRGELIALRWRDVDFERSSIRIAGSYANGVLTTTKSGHGRVVPMVPEVAALLARVSERDYSVGDDELVFPGDVGTYFDGSALRRRFVAACKRSELRPIRFHDLRHSFGTLAVRGAESIVELQNWLGQAEVRTTMRYTHYREQQNAAARLSAAFRIEFPRKRSSPDKAALPRKHRRRLRAPRRRSSPMPGTDLFLPRAAEAVVPTDKPLDGRSGRTCPVVTGWLVPDDDPPRISAYVDLPRRT